MLQVTERLTRLVQKHEGGIVVIEGEPGMGKTRLLEELELESMGQRQSQDPSQGQQTPSRGLPGLRKLCNVFVANGDLANKSKVSCCAVFAWHLHLVVRSSWWIWQTAEQLSDMLCL